MPSKGFGAARNMVVAPDEELADFHQATFNCFLSGSSVGLTQMGQLKFQLVVEAKDIDDAWDIRHLVRNPVALTCTLTADPDYYDQRLRSGRHLVDKGD